MDYSINPNGDGACTNYFARNQSNLDIKIKGAYSKHIVNRFVCEGGADFMQAVQNQRENINAQSGRFFQRIGSTMYSVNVHFKEKSQETLEEKILRIIKRDLEQGPNRESFRNDLRNPRKSGIMNLPQADRLSERGVL